ncbi:cytochrome c3 family protein [Shewanella algidipiscicola]|uniref:cytochrome c3 family protein n=1 Tax=Shewanella algidipiscicola TaxID=614070 RepID=UPI000D78455F|nr:cytochrome c3 family protein [Shewanella algidipiscicola]
MSLFSKIAFCAVSISALLLLNIMPVKAEVNRLQINQDKCVKCHKRNGLMAGVHGNDALALTCQSCHGEKGKHPRQPSLIIGFSADSSTKVTAQVDSCSQCHEHDVLYQADWTHAVHSNKVGCANCHQLHSDSDPMMTLATEERSALCGKCHGITPKESDDEKL